MKIIQQKVKLGEIVKGFNKSQYTASKNDIYCFDGKLNCRPAYQRNYVYKGKEKAAVINTIMKGYESRSQFPLSIMYWALKEDGKYELLDGQQRILSICLFRWGEAVNIDGKPIQWGSFEQSEKDWFNNYELDVYICVDDQDDIHRFEADLKDWFQVINTNGMQLTEQEKRNAIYYGPWLSDAKRLFSNDTSELFKEGKRSEKYIITPKKDDFNRQLFLEKVLGWRAKSLNTTIDGYMSSERDKANARDLDTYYNDVLYWVEEMFPEYHEILKRDDWGTLYNEYYGKVTLDVDERKRLLKELMDDIDVVKKNLIVKYILSNKTTKLEIRGFDDSIRERTHALQGGECPLCINEQALYPEKEIKTKHKLKEMEADHVIPWAKGGHTVESNCCMLCGRHNKQKSADEIAWLEHYMEKLRRTGEK